LSAYVLQRNSAFIPALEAACDRGARVDVVLDGASDRRGDAVARVNAGSARDLARHGAHVRLTEPNEIALHMKAAIVDGTAYLDDRNWASGDRDTIVALDDATAVATIAAALDGRPISQGQLVTEKQAAVALEAATIYAAAGGRIDVESETFGATVVSKALAFRAAHGAQVRLLVSQAELRGHSGVRERQALARLAAAGVDIRTTGTTDKFAVAGDDAWLGSANATFAPQPTLDWGYRSRDPAIARGVERAFERNWQSSAPSNV
jgi:phosphatidylserine/phosphatidylglycerophosphate/cardiolipin synthase-like enzyme